MFWNDPNLYSVAFKDVPTPRFFNPYVNFNPYMNPAMFTPQFPQVPQIPQFPQFTPPFTPQFTSQFTPPVTPYFHTPNFPWIDRTMSPYGYNLPYFQGYQGYQGYRPFGL